MPWLRAVWFRAHSLLSPEQLRFIRFLIVGGINTLFSYLVFCAFLYVGLHYTIAGLLSTVLGILWNFHTTGRLVFDGIERRQLIRFIGVYAFLYVLGVGELRAGELLGYTPYITSFVLILPNALIGYVCNKLFVFQPKLRS